jgi:succinate dehydrogenase/fumarate reductase flavoprotein subunit
MPATFGDFSTGDGIKLTTAGAGTCLMEKVQVHPTGFIDPADPSSSSKFLCVELLRGMGAILFVSL